MTTQDFQQIALFFALLIGLTPVLGNLMSKLFTWEKHFMLPLFGWPEKLTYKLIDVKPYEETNWKSYTYVLLMLNMIFVKYSVYE